jgi:hypothetical protein
MIKHIYHESPFSAVAVLILFILLTFCMLIVEYETYTIPTFFEAIWYIFISMTTVGFGKLFTQNIFGKISIIIVIFIGSICTATVVSGL